MLQTTKAMMMFLTPSPRTVIMVIAIKIVGTAMNMSIILIITWSTLPPKKPATEPIITPKMKDRSMMHMPANREIRPPYITRASMSRP